MKFETQVKIAYTFMGLVCAGFLTIIVMGIASDWQGFLNFMLAILWIAAVLGFLAMLYWSVKVIDKHNNEQNERYINKYVDEG